MDTTATTPIALADATTAPTISETLAQAFHDDPVFAWIVPDPARRRAHFPAVFAAFVDAYLPYHATYVVGEGVGAALWAPAGTDPLAGDAGEAFGERLATALGDDVERGLELGARFAEHRPAEPAAYLQLIGVVPAHQGRGHGRRLLDPVLQRCDTTGTPAYLEATSEANRRLYQRHGFEATAEIRLPQGPAVWPMWREPQTMPAAVRPRGGSDRTPARPAR